MPDLDPLTSLSPNNSPSASNPKAWPFTPEKFKRLLLYVGLYFFSVYVLGYAQIWHGYFDIHGNIIAADFVAFWAAAKFVVGHHVADLFDPQLFRDSINSIFHHDYAKLSAWGYPPILLLWISWTGYLSYVPAYILWMGIILGLYLCAVTFGRSQPWQLSGLLLFAPATLQNIIGGQNGFLSAALLVGGLRLLDKNPTIAGILFGCMAYKPQLAVLIPIALIIGGYWRSLFYAGLTACVLIGLTIVFYGMDPWLVYFEKTAPCLKHLMSLDAKTLGIFAQKMPTFFMAARILGTPLSVAYGLTLITATLAIFGVYYTFRHTNAVDLRAAVFLTAVFLTSPYAFAYDLTILTAGLICLLEATGSRLRKLDFCVIALAWILPHLVFYLNLYMVPISPLIISALLLVELRLVRDGARTLPTQTNQ
jgi:hypothetical protein